MATFDQKITKIFTETTAITGIDFSFQQLETILQTIKQDCQPFLKQGVVLFRGMDDDKHFLFDEKKIRKDRKSLSTPGLIDWMLKQFYTEQGWPLRSSSMFCSPARRYASSYGALYLVFPKGNFNSIYFNEVTDTYDLWEPFVRLSNNPYLRDYDTLKGKTFAETVQNFLQMPVPPYQTEQGKNTFETAKQTVVKNFEFMKNEKQLNSFKDLHNEEVAIEGESFYYIRYTHFIKVHMPIIQKQLEIVQTVDQ
jgi:hypothetical protein